MKKSKDTSRGSKLNSFDIQNDRCAESVSRLPH